GRGVWILDDVSARQQLTPAVLSEAAHLFAPRAAAEIRSFNPKAHEGDRVFHGSNRPNGALIDFHLQRDSGDAAITILDATGALVAKLQPPHAAGLNRAVWNL